MTVYYISVISHQLNAFRSFHFLAVVNGSVMNIAEQVSLVQVIESFGDYTSHAKIGSYCRSVFSLLKNSPHSVCPRMPLQ